MLIADSGSTKTEWRCCKNGIVSSRLRTQGFNPSTTPLMQLKAELSYVAKSQRWEQEDVVWFYSTGTGTESRKMDLHAALQAAFPLAVVHVQDDLSGAARSTLREAGVVCILGTGSNAAKHRDGLVEQKNGGLGYLLGDEGSGLDLGRHLLKGVLEDTLPRSVRDFLTEKEGVTPENLLRDVYQAPRPHIRLAALAPWYGELLEIAAVRALLLERFVCFLRTNVLPLQAETLPVDTIGSIGYHYHAVFAEACQQLHLQPGKAILQPVEALTRYHLQV